MKRLLLVFFTVLLVSVVVGGVVGAVFYSEAVRDLPDIASVDDYRPPLVTTVYARDNSIIGYLYREKRFPVGLDAMPEHLVQAFLAAEDARFFQHRGVDFTAIVRAFIANTRDHAISQGGSTITQQLVKRLLLSPEKSYTRKLREAVLSFRLENRLSKQQILQMYLNHIYLGHGAYGVESAARTYFAKHVDELTLAESAVLACLPQAPSRHDPYYNFPLTRERQRWVLERMRELGFITRAEQDQALAQPMVFASMTDPSWTLGAWYLEEVRRNLVTLFEESNARRLGIDIGLYGEDAVYEGGLHVYTAMDPIHQRAAETALRAGLHAVDHRQGWRGPLRKLSPDQYAAFLNGSAFSPADLDNGGWAEGLVIAVDKNRADVLLSNEYRGVIRVADLGWCRKPDPAVDGRDAARVGNAAAVLSPGDVIQVSAVGARGARNPVSRPADPDNRHHPTPVYDPAAVRPGVPVPLCLEQTPRVQGAVASIETATGDLVALVGGYQFSPDSQFNRATQALRQPGSSFKPIVYSAALDAGIAPGTIVHDEPLSVPDPYTGQIWSPGNADRKYLGAIPVTRALSASRNACTMRVALRIGLENVVDRAHALGIPGPIPAVPAVSLGSYEASPLSMAEAFTAFANQGRRTPARAILAVRDANNEPLIAFPPEAQQVISPQNAYIMTHLLERVVKAGTGRAARALNRPLAGKTGTTNDERDAWFIGYTPHLVTSVYVGHDDHISIGRREYGARAALPVFVRYRQAVEQAYPADEFAMPTGIVWSAGNPQEGGSASSYPWMEGQPMVADADYGGGEEGEGWIALDASFW